MKELLEHCIIIYIGLISAAAFILFGIDKQKAKKHKWRIPEKTLLGICLMGGFVGGFLGMQAFRHKTKHWYFYAVIVLSAVIWAFLLYILWT
ncbi:MAG: DUF1294 domain-containing protein [Ruminococcus sp.]|nr:DUF1294 domain-containing protein [Ruminococcus sp.]